MLDINKEQPISTDVRLTKYCKNQETTEDEIFQRVSVAAAGAEKTAKLRKQWAGTFYQNMKNGAIGAGRIMSVAGTDINATSINCFVQGIGDSISEIVDGYPGIYSALAKAAETMRRGGGVGYDFSRIRPKNAHVKGTASFASGPCSYIDIFDKSCETVESAGFRRGAQLSALRIDHPDIEEYVVAKRTEGRWNNFNVSVFVSDVFMAAVENDLNWELVHKAAPTEQLIKEFGSHQRPDGVWVYKVIKARDLWDKIMKSNYDFAEPGILFGDNINNNNNLRYIEIIEATNPCGEQNLPQYGCCDLGPIILPKFVKNPFKPNASLDFDKLINAAKIQVRFLDNILDITYWPLEEQKQEAMSKRRIGVGFTGLGNALAMLGLGYNTQEGRDMANKISNTMMKACYRSSIELAKEKGKFPLFNADRFLEKGTFASRLPKDIKADIRKYGLRNSHLLSIAPTGTVSLAFADNASNGIEPPFSWVYKRKKRRNQGGYDEFLVVDHSLRVFLSTIDDKELVDGVINTLANGESSFIYKGYPQLVKDCLPKSMVTALEMTAQDHLEMMKAVQPNIDASISKTINVAENYPYDDFKNIYIEAHKAGLKGIATYRPNNILGSILSTIEAKPEEAKVDEETRVVQELTPFFTDIIEPRVDIDYSATRRELRFHGAEGEEVYYILISYDDKTIQTKYGDLKVERPIEVFLQAEVNPIAKEFSELFTRNVSLLARSNFEMFCKSIRNAKKVIGSTRIRYGTYEKADGTTVPRYHGSSVAVINYVIQETLKNRGIIDSHGYPYKPIDLYRRKSNKMTSAMADENGFYKDPIQLFASYLDLHNIQNKEEALAQFKKEFQAISPEQQIIADIKNKTFIDTSNMPENNIIPGKLCKECGNAAVIRKDGCDYCTACGNVGSCG